MAKHLWATTEETKYIKSYKTRATAIKKAEEFIGDRNIRFVIVATEDGRFMPVAIGTVAAQEGLHFHMAVAA